MNNKFKLYNGEYVDKEYFDNTLNDLVKEEWIKKNMSELAWDHINCLLSFETISKQTSEYYYESNKNNILSEAAYNEYIKPVIS
jgi:hypothetical protein